MTLKHRLVRAVGELPDPLKRRVRPGTLEPSWSPSEKLRLRGEASRLLVGPANSAGQGFLWARAADQVEGWSGTALEYTKKQKLGFAADLVAEESTVVYSPAWCRSLREEVMDGFDAFLSESLLPIFGSLYLQDPEKELRMLRDRGLKVGVVLHGSDIRRPVAQSKMLPGSVFLDAPPDSVATLDRIARKNGEILDRLDVPVFVSTPDQLVYRPEASWLPTQLWETYAEAPAAEVSETRRPRVLHLPTRGYLKGSQWIDPALRELESRGVIHYLRPERVAHGEMRALLEQADIVVDALGMGAYGVTSLEALALGKVVVSQVGGFVREKVHELTGTRVPIVEATKDTLAEVVGGLASDPGERLRLGSEGRRYVETVHSRKAAADVLAPFLAH